MYFCKELKLKHKYYNMGAKCFEGTIQVRQLTIQRTYGHIDVGV